MSELTIAELEAQLKAAKEAERQERYRQTHSDRMEFLSNRIKKDAAELQKHFDKGGFEAQVVAEVISKEATE